MENIHQCNKILDHLLIINKETWFKIKIYNIYRIHNIFLLNSSKHLIKQLSNKIKIIKKNVIRNIIIKTYVKLLRQLPQRRGKAPRL